MANYVHDHSEEILVKFLKFVKRVTDEDEIEEEPTGTDLSSTSL
jgi:hypothetical protein